VCVYGTPGFRQRAGATRLAGVPDPSMKPSQSSAGDLPSPRTSESPRVGIFYFLGNCLLTNVLYYDMMVLNDRPI